MHVLFVHQNFPAQFRYIAPRLVSDYGWRCTFATAKAEGSLLGVEKIVYRARGGATRSNHLCTRSFENAVGQAHGAYEALKARRDLEPDLIVAHTGFGSSLFLPYLWDAPIINFLEYFYRPTGGDLGYRPETSVTEAQLLRIKARNAMILLDLENCDRGWTPTYYQRDYFPRSCHDKIDVIFDGIDTDVYYRKDNPTRQIGNGVCIDPKHRIVTYVARGFELMRGFDIFMKTAKRIYEQFPDVRFVVVGTDTVHYGGDLKYTGGQTFRQHTLGKDDYDLSKFHFTGYVPQETLADILSISDLHIYLTEPFIASWSMVDAMACGAVLLASDQNCVREYITHGQNGLLGDFFDYERLARQAVEVLKDPQAFRHLGESAHRTVEEKYSLKLALPRLKNFFERVGSQRRSPSTRLESLVRKGTWQVTDPDEAEEFDESNLSHAAAPAPQAPPAQVRTERTPQPVSEPLVSTGNPQADAITMMGRLVGQRHTVAEWVAAAQSFRGPAPLFARLGPSYHPADLCRLLQRVAEWKPRLVVDLGTGDGGMLFLLCRAAMDTATLITAALPGRETAPEKIAFLQAMAKKGQRVSCIPVCRDREQLAAEIDKACGGKKIDVLFMDGFRPHEELRADFRHYRNRVRRNGLIAWSGVNPMVAPDAQGDGGHRLWQEVKPMYPFSAEYLSGANGLSGGIVMVRI